MRIRELKNELKRNGINENVCVVEAPYLIDGALCLVKKEDKLWVVVLTERGECLIREEFEREHDACRFFLRKALSDPTSYKNFTRIDLRDFKEKKEKLLKKYGF